ncbi:Z1 domain-containing protein [Thermobifida halotolerans]|uniref:Z1 domain-containing protein n=1 Tax=Thermobifida halotolerans TaxID=483545 RepID=A0AA97M363_9ACTN|nr:Z1 domain-containing protein [Thermobifida halotolerans]UOE18854.1 Z1 domain-containing protein [Thermobifida halotolerans]
MLDLTEAALLLAKQQVSELPRHERTPERLREIVRRTLGMLSDGGTVSADVLFRRLEAEFDVWVPRATVVSDPSDHVPWLEERRGEIDFSYWRRYADWFRRTRRESVVEALDETTDQILGLLEDPRRAGEWKTYGMVYGQVQSGKTANYTGVICKAVDAGYRVIIVLTSQHESLRHQTQARLDLEFLGFNSRFSRDRTSDSSMDIGVGNLGRVSTICIPVTTQDSDFTTAQFQGTPVNIHEVPILVVAKKNARILANLRDWLGNFASGPQGEPKLVGGAPLLLIDDEADYASVDTKRPTRGGDHSDPEHDPTAINKAIRGLLELFEKRAYLGYTATPFANIFIPHSTDHPEHGEDLFPRSFLVTLEPPSNYCGPELVFGLEDPTAADIREPLPIVHEVGDHRDWMPDGHRKGHVPDVSLPGSLVEALDAFVLATAIRKARERNNGEVGGHNTMLVHVTRFTDVQGEVARQIEHHLRRMADSWGDYGDAGIALQERLTDLWKRDFVPTHEEIANRDDVSAQVGPRVSWEDIESFVPHVLDEAAANVKRINGSVADVLDYQSSTPVTVVAVGGDKLSRGLTLEGLTVSYYLRASRTYDTLLQMGRWFGYRPGYLDVIRLYTTRELINYYVHITRANRELMDLTAAISRAQKTPGDVGLRIREGTGNLQVTAAAKMRSSTAMKVSLAGTRAETLVMRTDRKAQEDGHERLQRLVERILPLDPVPEERLHGAGRGLFRRNVPPEAVVEFLEGFHVSPRVLTANPDNLLSYIRKQTARGELVRWVVGITGGSSKKPLPVQDVDIPLIKRRTITHARVLDGECEVGVLVSPAHEALGLAPSAKNRAFERTVDEFHRSGRGREPKRASGDALRRVRDPGEGLLLLYPIDPAASEIEVGAPGLPVIGYAVVFPHSEQAERISYRVNEVFLESLRKAVEDSGDGEE